MQTLCKPPRKIYDAKAIEACHNEEEGLDLHDVKHGMTATAIGAAAGAYAGPYGAAVGATVGLVLYVTEAEETITHTLEEWGNDIADAADAVADAFTSAGAGGGATTGAPLPPMNDDGTFGSHAPGNQDD